MRALRLDAQRVLVPDEAELDALEASPLLEGQPVGAGRILSSYRALSQREPALSVGLGERAGGAWSVMHLLHLGDETLRVHLESQACAGCGAVFLTALTRHYNLYEGTPDPLAALVAAGSRPTLGCPHCGGALDQAPVWLSQVMER